MKLRFLKYIIPIVIISIIVACDIIPEDSYITPIEDPGDPGQTVTNKRVVLIEEFTGHKCPNCPKAAEEAEKLQKIYGESIIIIALHSGMFSVPIGQGFNANYRTPEGNEIHDYFELQSYPKGMVNRIKVGSSALLDFGAWEAQIPAIIEQDAVVSIEFEQTYNEESRQLQINVATIFSPGEPVPAKLCAFITESGMISPQTNGPNIIEEYEHNHVLRGSFDETGTWGLELKGLGTETNILNITLKDEWVSENCEIVVYVYNTQTMEVLQAATQNVK